MEMKSVSDFSNFIDDALVENNGKFNGISNLEKIHTYLLEKRQSNFIEDRVTLSNMFSQMNSIIENDYQFDEGDIKSEYIQLIKLIIALLIECGTEPEVDD